jgi:hypothetical protein
MLLSESAWSSLQIDNPTCLILSSISNWFPERRVLQRRKALHDEAEQAAEFQRQLATQLAELRSICASPPADDEKRR